MAEDTLSFRKIAIVTGTRAEYGYLRPLISRVYEDTELDLQLYVTGSHLVKEFGYSVSEVEKDFPITRKININLRPKNTRLGMVVSSSVCAQKFAKAFLEDKPDIVFVLGDRFEIFAVTYAAYFVNLPIAHISGGEVTYGTVDDNLRHAITKLSNLHFVSTETYQKRVLQLGEEPWRIHNVGALSLEDIHKIKILKKQEFFEIYKLKKDFPLITVVYHPLTKEDYSVSKREFKNIVKSLKKLSEKLGFLNLVFIYPNIDPGSYLIVEELNKLKNTKNVKILIFKNLSHDAYINLLANSDVLIGNTSSGIIEAPSLGLPYVCVGDRQKGRVRASNVIDVPSSRIEPLVGAVKKALFNEDFLNLVKRRKNPYYKPNPSKRIVKIIKKKYSRENFIKKKFVDVLNGK